MTLFTNTPPNNRQRSGRVVLCRNITSVLQSLPCSLFVFQPHSEQGFQAVVQQSAMLLHGKVA